MSWAVLTALLAAAASLVTAFAVLLSVVVTIRGQRKLIEKTDQVHAEVKTSNGITMAALADRTEGRRIQSEVPKDDRTASEQGYVDTLHEGGRDMGHTEKNP